MGLRVAMMGPCTVSVDWKGPQEAEDETQHPPALVRTAVPPGRDWGKDEAKTGLMALSPSGSW